MMTIGRPIGNAKALRTLRQREVYDVLVSWIERHGTSPSYGQMAFAIGVSSRATVHKHVSALIRQGMVIRGRNAAGGYILRPASASDEVIEMPPKPCAAIHRPPVPTELKWEIWERDNFTCLKCGSRRYLTIDHKIPFSKGGETRNENLQTLCQMCNSLKGNKLEE